MAILDLFKKDIEDPFLRPVNTIQKIPKLGSLETSDGLYNLAKEKGLQKEADEVMALHSGEERKQIFSGGVVMDGIDLLNVGSYGVVGWLKGKGFREGINNRETFSSQDSMGQYGLVGSVLGMALDIAVDPLMYIAPWKLITRIPGVAAKAKGAKEFLIGKEVKRIIDLEKGKIFIEREGAVGFEFKGKRIEPFKYFADKVLYMFGMDPIYKKIWERMMTKSSLAEQKIRRLLQDFDKIDPKVAKNVLKRTPDGLRFERVDLGLLKRTLSNEDFSKIEPIFNKIDNLSIELNKLGVLGDAKLKETFGKYLKNVFAEYELARRGLGAAAKKRGISIKSIKARKEGLDLKRMKELGQIEDPAYILGRTMLTMARDLEHAKFLNQMEKHFASKVEFAGSVQVPSSPGYMVVNGKVAEARGTIRSINKALKPLFKQYRQSGKVEEEVLREIDDLEDTLDFLGTRTRASLEKYFAPQILRGGITDVPERWAVTEKRLREFGLMDLAVQAQKFDTFEELMKSKTGKELLKMSQVTGQLGRAGYKTVSKFYEAVREPFTPPKVAKRKGKIKQEAIFEDRYGIVISQKAQRIVRRETKFVEDVKEAEKIAKAAKKEGVREAKTKPGLVSTQALALRKGVGNIIERIQNLKKTSVKRGVKAGAELKTIETRAAQNELINLIKKNFRTIQPKFLTKIRNTKNLDDLEKQIKSLSDDFEDMIEAQFQNAGELHLRNAISFQTRVEKLLPQLGDLRQIDLPSVKDSTLHLASTIDELVYTKEYLKDSIDLQKMGSLAGKFVPEQMWKYVEDVVSPRGMSVSDMAMASFKYSKVILNPATHARNVMSNIILNWWKLGIGPWNVHEYAEALREIRLLEKGITKNVSKEALLADRIGMGAASMAANEFNLYKRIAGEHLVGEWTAPQSFKNTIDKFASWYQMEESMAKLVAFKRALNGKIPGMGKLNPEEAWKVAESATFNYAQVTPFIRRMRTAIWGVPFITFAIKAAPIGVETLAKNPHRISFFGKLRNTLNEIGDVQETEEELRTIPKYIRDGFYIKLPFKDEKGRSAYFDLTYILPLGDLLSGSLLIPQVKRNTGLKESPSEKFATNLPFINLIGELQQNEDFYGRRIWRDSDSTTQKIADMGNHVMKMFAPPWMTDQFAGGYEEDGSRAFTGIARAVTASPENQRRTITQELLRNMGLKVLPIDQDLQENLNEWNRKKGLRRLLLDKGIGKEFSQLYVPKGTR